MASQASSSNAPAIQGEPTSLIPKDSMQFRQKILPRNLISLFKKLDSPGKPSEINVRVVYMYSPSHIWLQQLGSQQRELERITREMDEFFLNNDEGRFRTLDPRAAKVGLYCCGWIHGEWFRLKIVKVYGFYTKVLLIDYGMVVTVPVSTLHPLLSKWGRLPQQAIRARLGGVRPKINERVWNLEFTAKLWKMLENKNLRAYFTHLNASDGVFRVLLSYSVESTGIMECLNVELRNLGIVDKDDLSTRRLRRFENPEFYELENGMTHTYEELLVLKRFDVGLRDIPKPHDFSFYVSWMGYCKADIAKPPRVGISLETIKKFWNSVNTQPASYFGLKEEDEESVSY